MIGPVLGGIIYAMTDYFWTFTIFGFILGFSMIITFIITPNALNNSVFDEDQGTGEGNRTV